MFISIEYIAFHVNIAQVDQGMATMVMLHGFGGTSDVFSGISKELNDSGISTVRIDLPGHGKTKAPLDPELFTIQSQVRTIRELLDELGIQIPWLYGYSMGGRIALRIATQTEAKLSGLILESAQLGFNNSAERSKRVIADKELAGKLRADASSFFSVWNRLPLFTSGSDKKSDEMLRFEQIQHSQDPQGLALSLEYMSPGLVPAILPEELEKTGYPKMILTGELDKKYNSMWTAITAIHKSIDHKQIKNAGHRIHLDQPALLSKELIHYIKSKHKTI
jgi:2-succinyl-6-hydroxy-2,4-cyclohexadiene-1-carboxylate synthase